MHRWQLLDRLAEGGVFDFPPGLYAELAERLREALISNDTQGVSSLTDQLAEILVLGARAALPEAAKAVRHEPSNGISASDQAYALGKLSFAHLLAAHIADKQAGAEFIDLLKSEVLAPYVSALIAEDLTGMELADRLRQRPETISRNLKKLREIGAVDYRREGTSFINFLTPAARRVSEAAKGRPIRANLTQAVRDRMQSEARGLPKIMRGAPNFANEIETSQLVRASDFAGT